ncbi:uncharacterized protein K441DRAFT_674068 [Cenococcum geophilum 1.58]|uniref:uncharacterized protein n=1 Tax=Cenococcum geophilum 1.58 TaxID=794803 RepID=UPI00358EA7E2|nr:hypothetical protein K441DRAFT_674068 [Cenococcum geophilum 1.58]
MTTAMVAIGISRLDAGDVLAVHSAVLFVKGLGPVMNIILAYAGHVAFSFCAELKRPSGFPKALAFMQTTPSTFYLLISAIIYYYAGPHVASPALGSASPIIANIAFGLALPTIITPGVVNGSMACKYIYMRMWKGTSVIHYNNLKSVGSWVGICGGCGSAHSSAPGSASLDLHEQGQIVFHALETYLFFLSCGVLCLGTVMLGHSTS